MRYSAAAMKSSKQFCFLSSVPALCHSSPYSPPPRILARQKTTPKCLKRMVRMTLKLGVRLTLNPPYPNNRHGFDLSRTTSFLATMNIGILVPSLLGTKT
uniref:Uncharacterized protein n=1 Tax=Opuntia streptacantha TaxID=393608 RepID=A0A7C8YKA9_OPUST